MAHHIEIPLLDQTYANEATEDEKQEGSQVDCLIDIKETNGEDQSGLQTNKFTIQVLDGKLEELNNGSTKPCTILRVSVGLSESKPDAYKPRLISIGPYHNKNPQLRSMKKYKLMYLQRFLRRKEGIDVESCISELEKLKDEALMCYDDLERALPSDYPGRSRFLEILLLDGCFVVEYIRESCGIFPEGEDTIIKGDCIDNQVCRDLLLLENQLPFFVLTKLHDMTKVFDEVPFTLMAKCTFLSSVPQITLASFFETVGNAETIKHLLHLVHMSCLPSEKKTSNKSLCWNLLQKNRPKETPIDENHQQWHDIMRNATELCEAGVSFTQTGTLYRGLVKDNLEDSTSLLDITFENGLMEIPTFKVVDNTESILRNLIAFEQQSSNVRPAYFSDYAVFMDRLIDSERDVSLLRLKGIIRNTIGEDKEVARLFNKIGKGVVVSSDNFYYIEECRKAVQHCEKTWNRMKANLSRNYFHSPWAGLSTVAAIILLLLTATQTVLSFISTLK